MFRVHVPSSVVRGTHVRRTRHFYAERRTRRVFRWHYVCICAYFRMRLVFSMKMIKKNYNLRATENNSPVWPYRSFFFFLRLAKSENRYGHKSSDDDVTKSKNCRLGCGNDRCPYYVYGTRERARNIWLIMTYRIIITRVIILRITSTDQCRSSRVRLRRRFLLVCILRMPPHTRT